MVIDVALEEDGHVGKGVVMLDDVVQISMAFAANVWKSGVCAGGCIFGTALGVDGAQLLDIVEPR